MKNVFNEEEMDKKSFENRWVKFAFGPNRFIDTENLNIGIVEFYENKDIKSHSHNVEEAMYILAGKGKIKIGNYVYIIKEKDFVYIPKNEDHSVISDINRRLKILFVFGKVALAPVTERVRS